MTSRVEVTPLTGSIHFFSSRLRVKNFPVIDLPFSIPLNKNHLMYHHKKKKKKLSINAATNSRLFISD